MSTRPEALRLADELCAAPERSRTSFEAATELRRLHELNQELVEALKDVMRVWFGETQSTSEDWDAANKARAALAKASGSATQTGETE